MTIVSALRRASVSVVAAVALAMLGAAGVSAATAPQSGATVGGTVVSGPVPDAPVLTVLAAGAHHAVAIGSDGQTYAWGEGSFGQLGDGTASNSSVPVPVSAPEGVSFTSVSAGLWHTVAIGSDGQTYAWGEGAAGQLGNGGTSRSAVPRPVSAPEGVSFTSVSAGSLHTVATGSDGQTYAWGDGAAGQLGDGARSNVLVPVPVSAPEGVSFTSVSAGSLHTVAIDTDGQAYAWGEGGAGQLGDGDSSSSSVPVPVSAPSGVTFTSVSAGALHTLAVGSDGEAYAWGTGSSGQLGNGSTSDVSVPAPVSAPVGVSFTAVSAGYDFSLALGADGQAYAWGEGAVGQLGDGGTSSSSSPVPVSVPEGVSFRALWAGLDHAYALGPDGRAYAWGAGYYGQLGDGSTSSSLVPVLVDSAAVVESVTFGGAPGEALTQDGERWTATTPPGRCGPVDIDITYTRFGATHTQTVPAAFTYGAPPVITAHPTGSELPAGGGTVTLAATARGDDSPSVVWQRAATGTQVWSDIHEADGTTIEVGDAGDYRAVFTNCLGSVTTDVATVSPGPSSPVPTVPLPAPDPLPGPTDPVRPPGADGAPAAGALPVENGPAGPVLASSGVQGIGILWTLVLVLVASGTALVGARVRDVRMRGRG